MTSDAGVASSQPPEAATAVRGRRPLVERSADFDHLALDELRAYRDELADEENWVSYWRRVMQARMDIVQRRRPGAVDRNALRRLLTTERVNAGRTALIRIVPADGMPPLPALEELWAADAADGDHEGNGELIAALEAAERQLSEYRRSLHARIDAATGELVARYRERPALAVRALPLGRTPQPRAGRG